MGDVQVAYVQFSKLISRTLSDFLKFDFHLSLPKLGLLFVEKRKTKIVGFKNATEEEIRKFLTFIIRQIATKIFGKMIFKPLYFRKGSSSPRMTEQIQIL